MCDQILSTWHKCPGVMEGSWNDTGKVLNLV